MSDEITEPAEDEPEAPASEVGEDTEAPDPEIVLHSSEANESGCVVLIFN